MNTALCAEVMKVVSRRAPRNAQWSRLGMLVSRNVEKTPEASVEDLAEKVLHDYRGDYADSDVE